MDQSETPEVLTGQVPVGGDPWPECPDHKEVQHRDGQPPWCNRCGWNRGAPAIPAAKVGRANGGWGTPHGGR